ncbi:zinc finger, CCHC-type containing protein [Tanacetum coccineum]
MLKPSNYSLWAIRMQIILEANGLWEMIEPLESTQDDNRKDKTAIAFLYQSLPEEQLLQITKHKTAKAIGDALKTRHIGEERVKPRSKHSNPKNLRRLLHPMNNTPRFRRDSVTKQSKMKTFEERIKSKKKIPVDSQESLMFTQHEGQRKPFRERERFNQSRGREQDKNNYKREERASFEEDTRDKTPVTSTSKFAKVIEYSRLLGCVMAKALQDDRLLDLPLSTAFYKLVLGQQLDLMDVSSFDAARAASSWAPVEDLCLDFTLPGYPDFTLKSGDEDVNINNLEEYVSLVVSATVKTGITRQMEAFRAGFNQSKQPSSTASNVTSSANGLSELADDDLPSLMTCANYLKLPSYSTQEIMYKQLLYAISEGQGSFDLS